MTSTRQLRGDEVVLRLAARFMLCCRKSLVLFLHICLCRMTYPSKLWSPNLRTTLVRSTEFHAAAHGVTHSRVEIAGLARQALRNPAIKAALESPRLWSEIPVAAEIETRDGSVVIEGILDLLYQDSDDDLVVVDYKSDYIPDDATLSAKMERYRWQGAAYAAAVGKASGRRVKDVQLLFVRRDEALSIGDLDMLTARLPHIVTNRRDHA